MPGQAGEEPRWQPRREDRAVGHPDLLDLGLLQPLGLGPPVLKPNLHLRLCQAQAVGELCPLCNAEVLLLPKLLLQRHELLRGEGRPRLAVRLVLAQGAPQGAQVRTGQVTTCKK